MTAYALYVLRSSLLGVHVSKHSVRVYVPFETVSVKIKQAYLRLAPLASQANDDGRDTIIYNGDDLGNRRSIFILTDER